MNIDVNILPQYHMVSMSLYFNFAGPVKSQPEIFYPQPNAFETIPDNKIRCRKNTR